MRKFTGDKHLESYRIFPFISWALIIGFSVFVYKISLRLDAVAQQLDEQTQYLEEQSKSSVLDLQETRKVK